MNYLISFPNRFAVVQVRTTYWANDRTVAIAQVGATTPGPTTVGPTGATTAEESMPKCYCFLYTHTHVVYPEPP